MSKSKVVESFYQLINIYKDFAETGFAKEHVIPDFSGFDNIPDVEQPSSKKPIMVVKNPDSKEEANKKKKLIEIASGILKCNKCNINSKVKIPGSGDVSAKIFVVSYFPTAIEEKLGRPFAGETGDFFRKWMESIKVNYDDLFLSHLVKCNPGGNAVSRDSIEICKGHLDDQLEVIKPEVILALGEVVLSSLCKKFMPLAENHGKKFEYDGIPVIATYHPFDVLKNPALKKAVWEDLKKFSAYIKGSAPNA